MVSISSLKTIGNDNRGATFSFENDRTGEFIVIQRRKDSISGCEYHTGIHPSKSPEKLVILSGTVLLEWVDLNSDEFGEAEIIAPAAISIPAMVWHRIITLEDAIILEQNGLDAAKDTIKVLEHPLKKRKAG